jgi:hypothetical protein
MADIKQQYLWLIERMKRIKNGTMEIHIQDGVPVKTSNEKGTADHVFENEKNIVEIEKEK